MIQLCNYYRYANQTQHPPPVAQTDNQQPNRAIQQKQPKATTILAKKTRRNGSQKRYRATE